MLYVVFYDITDNGMRNKVADLLKKKGLTRVQYSVFIGDLNSARLKDVVAGLRVLQRYNKEGRFSILVLPVTQAMFSQRITIGDEFKEDEGEVVW
ncbi:CRISPR-associated endonuclease Cas2 [Acidianus sp. HS-5]|uniref:CRISPR-associated endonuclease Cas2 n=1 Tax=Acidianus sp. HS-5 TaxID=2886040 RepID=UPI001F015C0D|nr:CRISPR-associated endonuclease Cas2 [Acidianus sp. HS-5]BDC18765.1 CRISPR-associated protein Cas2 [Acidianus sp. HS-5]